MFGNPSPRSPAVPWAPGSDGALIHIEEGKARTSVSVCVISECADMSMRGIISARSIWTSNFCCLHPETWTLVLCIPTPWGNGFTWLGLALPLSPHSWIKYKGGFYLPLNPTSGKHKWTRISIPPFDWAHSRSFTARCFSAFRKKPKVNQTFLPQWNLRACHQFIPVLWKEHTCFPY